MTVKTTVERGNAYLLPRLYNVEVTLLEIVRGKRAWERLNTQFIPAKPLELGFEYILTRIKFRYFSRGRESGYHATYKLSEGQFAAVSTDGTIDYGIPPVLQQPQPHLIDWLFNPGESREGWILLQAPQNDTKPLLIFKREHAEGIYGIWGYVWFQLY